MMRHRQSRITPASILPVLMTGAILTVSVWAGNRGAIAQSGPNPWRFWNDIFSNEPPVPPSEGGGRGEVCLIAPLPTAEQVAQVWHAQPTLVWWGDVSRLAVKQSGQEEILWQFEDSLTGTATYDGEPLTPGTVYEWLVYLPYSTQPAFSVPFVIVPLEQQAEITQDLQQIDQQQAESASPEAQAIQRADYFASRGLWSDFWHEILAINNPSEDLENALDEVVTRLCDP